MKKNHKLGFSLVEISVVVLIIGVLIAAITTGTDLVKRSKNSSAQNLSSNTSIYGMKDLVLWLEPSLPTSFDDESEGEALTLWSNNSPFYNIGSAVINGINDTPIYVKHSINHIPSVKFTLDDGGDISGDDVLIINNISNLLEDVDLSIFIVENRDDGLTIRRNIINSSGGTDGGLDIYYNAADQFTVNSKDGVAASATSTSTGPNLHYLSLLAAASNFTIGSDIIIRNGFNYYNNKKLPESGSMPAASSVIDSSTTPRFEVNSIGNITLGSISDSYIGDISEIIIFNRKLRKQELHDIFRYFEAKYNLSLSTT